MTTRTSAKTSNAKIVKEISSARIDATTRTSVKTSNARTANRVKSVNHARNAAMSSAATISVTNSVIKSRVSKWLQQLRSNLSL